MTPFAPFNASCNSVGERSRFVPDAARVKVSPGEMFAGVALATGRDVRMSEDAFGRD